MLELFGRVNIFSRNAYNLEKLLILLPNSLPNNPDFLMIFGKKPFENIVGKADFPTIFSTLP